MVAAKELTLKQHKNMIVKIYDFSFFNLIHDPQIYFPKDLKMPLNSYSTFLLVVKPIL